MKCPDCNGTGSRMYAKEVSDGCDLCNATGQVEDIALAPAGGGNIKSWGFRAGGVATTSDLPGTVTGTLDIEFVSGALYRYYEVPRYVFTELTSSRTIGSDFHHLIKQGGYRYKKLKDAPPKKR